MKKTVFIFIFLFSITAVFSQQKLTWLSVGLTGGYGSSLLFNQPSFDDVNVTYSAFSPTYVYGGRFAVLFGDNVGISLEVSQNSMSQFYEIDNGNELVNSSVKMKTSDFSFYLDLQSLTGFYFSAGPRFSDLKSAVVIADSVEINRLNKFTPGFTSVIVQFGIKPVRTDKFEMRTGIRAVYGFNVISQNNYIIPADGTDYIPTYTDGKTNPLQLMFNVEFTYVFGRFGKASCGKYRFMFN